MREPPRFPLIMTSVAIIVCPQPQAAEIRLEVMRRGGNAVDAAVTCAFVQVALDPQMCGIGGCGVILVHNTKSGDALREFHAMAGSRAREDQWENIFIREAADRYGYVVEGWVNDVGYQSIGVPGTVAGLYEALNRFCTISWEQAIEAAIPLAREGFPVRGFMHDYWTTGYGADVVPNQQRIQATPAARAIYTHDGKLFAIGERMVQEDHARTLARLPREGPAVFYKGEIADAMAADFEANGGFVTKEDLANYTANVAEPLTGTYRGLRVAATGPPAGGLGLLQMLNFLEGYDVGAHGWPSSRLREFPWRRWRGRLPTASCTSPTRGSSRFPRERSPTRSTRPRLARSWLPGARAHDRADTTQVCTGDDAGNAVSLTHTLGSASDVVTPGPGFGNNDYMNCFDPVPAGPTRSARARRA
jgi:gamma-glutamyltranspeptidase/glutathione hydrolase